MSKHKFLIHVCALDRECRYYTGWMWRLHVTTPWWHVGVALRPADRFARMDGPANWVTARRW